MNVALLIGIMLPGSLMAAGNLMAVVVHEHHKYLPKPKSIELRSFL
jgi:hypothetical protein